MTKTLLIIGAGIEACEGIRIAREMDLRLIVVDGNPDAPGFEMADHKILASTYDGDRISEEVGLLEQNRINIDGVLAMCADVPLSVAKMADNFSLPGISVQAATWVQDKLLMKERLQEAGIPIPRFTELLSPTDQVENYLNYPVVIKPIDSRGARGVQLIENASQLSEGFELAKEESPTGRVIAEEYLSGPQVSTETLVDNGKCYTIGFTDRNYEWLEKTKPFFIENGGDAPSALSENAQFEIIDTVEKAALALGITQGVAKGDMVYTEEGAKVIEIAGRLSGGYFATTQIPIATGVNFVKQAIKLALGEELDINDITPKHQRGVAIRYLDIPPGTVESIEGIDEATNSAGVELISIYTTARDEIQPLTNHTKRAGFVICSGDTKLNAIERAQAALSCIKVKYA